MKAGSLNSDYIKIKNNLEFYIPRAYRNSGLFCAYKLILFSNSAFSSSNY